MLGGPHLKQTRNGSRLFRSAWRPPAAGGRQHSAGLTIWDGNDREERRIRKVKGGTTIPVRVPGRSLPTLDPSTSSCAGATNLPFLSRTSSRRRHKQDDFLVWAGWEQNARQILMKF